MKKVLKNKYLKFVSTVIVVMVVLAILGSVLISLLTSNIGLSGDSDSFGEAQMDRASINLEYAAPMSVKVGSDIESYIQPTPNTGNYTSDLESYETTSYGISGDTKEFDRVCSSLESLKDSPNVHFKSLNITKNRCSAILYSEESEVDRILWELAGYDDVDYTRNTISVTRHKQQIEGQTQILQEQLKNVNRSLVSTEQQYNELAELAKENNNADALSTAIKQELSQMKSLTNEKINLTSQLDRIYQQAADLQARLDVVEFSVNISRQNVIDSDKYEDVWSNTWNQLKDSFNNTLVNLTFILASFLLYVIQFVVYALILIYIAKYLWRLTRWIWNR